MSVELTCTKCGKHIVTGDAIYDASCVQELLDAIEELQQEKEQVLPPYEGPSMQDLQAIMQQVESLEHALQDKMQENESLKSLVMDLEMQGLDEQERQADLEEGANEVLEESRKELADES